jgi:type I restriction enzyme S subunit
VKSLVELHKIADVVMGQSPPSSVYNAISEGLPFFQGKAEFGAMHPTPSKWCSAPSKVAEANDVLMSIRAPVGPTNIAVERSCIGRGLAAIRPKQGVRSKWLLYAFRSMEHQIDALGTGTTFKSISGQTLRQLPVPIVPIAQQDATIAEIEKQFSRLDEAVAGLKRVKANLKRYKAAILKAAVEGRLVPTEADLARREGRSFETGAQLLQRILDIRRKQWQGKGKYKEPAAPDITELPELPEGWGWATVDQLAVVGTGATPQRDKVEFYQDGDIPWVTSAVVNQAYVDHASEFVTATALKKTNLTLYPAGTLLVAMYGEGKTRGKCAELRISATTNQALAALQTSADVRDYLRLFLEHNYEETRKIASGGVQPNLNLSLVRSIRLAFPPLAEQHRIVAEVDRLLSIAREAEQEIARNLERALALRQSILQKAFSTSVK